MILAQASTQSAVRMANNPAFLRLPPIRHASPPPPQQRRSPLRHHPYHHQPQRSSPQRPPTSLPPAPSAGRQHDEDFSLSDEDMLLCDDEDAWESDAPSSEQRKHRPPTTPHAAIALAATSNGRSRRLLSLEQSKVLYKILDKTHFPSTQLREAAAGQLGVSPRKVQVWFQNRRQVGKKRMMECVSSFVSTLPSPSAPISMDILQSHIKTTLGGKNRHFGENEDERTRAWRRHTIRLALNPSAQEEEECKAAIRELERGSRDYHQQYQGEERLRRPVPGLRINVVPHHQQQQQQQQQVGAAMPTYTGPGSATHLETLRTPRPMMPLTPATTRTIVPPAIVSSQKESFSLSSARATFPDLALHHKPQQQLQREDEYVRYHSGHHSQQQHLQQSQQHQQQAHQQRLRLEDYPGAGLRRDRSATLATTTSIATTASASAGWGDAKRLRTNLTAEWSESQQRLYTRSPPHHAPPPPPQLRYRSSTDALSRLGPLLPSLGRSARGDRYSPYPPPPAPAPPVQRQQGTGQGLLRPPPPAPTTPPFDVTARRNRSISSPIRRPPASSIHTHTRSGLRLSPPPETEPERWIAHAARTRADSLTPPRCHLDSPPTLRLSSHAHPRERQHRKSPTDQVRRETRDPMDVKTLTSSRIANVPPSGGERSA